MVPCLAIRIDRVCSERDFNKGYLFNSPFSVFLSALSALQKSDSLFLLIKLWSFSNQTYPRRGLVLQMMVREKLSPLIPAIANLRIVISDMLVSG